MVILSTIGFDWSVLSIPWYYWTKSYQIFAMIWKNRPDKVPVLSFDRTRPATALQFFLVEDICLICIPWKRHPIWQQIVGVMRKTSGDEKYAFSRHFYPRKCYVVWWHGLTNRQPRTTCAMITEASSVLIGRCDGGAAATSAVIGRRRIRSPLRSIRAPATTLDKGLSGPLIVDLTNF